MTPEQRKKLPAYAKRELDRLEMRLSEAEQKIAEMAGDTPGASRIEVMYLVDHEGAVLLPDRSQVRFHFPGERHVDIRIADENFTGRDSLEVVGENCVSVRPVSSNFIYVHPVPRS